MEPHTVSDWSEMLSMATNFVNGYSHGTQIGDSADACSWFPAKTDVSSGINNTQIMGQKVHYK